MTHAPARQRGLGSVIIPAHNEGRVLPRTLTALAQLVADGEIEVIVAANGCTDNTALVAGRFPGVRTVVVPEASKVAALNAADSVASCWPRIYLDADVSISPDTLRAVLHHLASGSTLAARPSMAYDTSSSSPFVRAYYRARSRLPELDRHLWGAGVYGLSREGRGRFEHFPDVTADDLYVDSLFAADEKVVVPTPSPVLVHAPRTRQDLLKVTRRAYRGNAALRRAVQPAVPAQRTAGSMARQLVRTISGPSSLADAGAYLLIAVHGRAQGGRGTGTWERDDSSRQVG